MNATPATRAGVTGYAAHIPVFRIDRSDIAAALGARASGRRSVAGFDEDPTTMAVQAAMQLTPADDATIWLASTVPAYLEKTNATAVHAALGLSPSAAAYDLGQSWRSGAAALSAAALASGVAIMADVRGGAVGSEDESFGGDAAAALSFGRDRVVADLLGQASATREFLDRWRLPGDVGASVWEERFGEGEYVPLAEDVIERALKDAGLAADEIDEIVVAGPNTRAVRTTSKVWARNAAARADTTDLLELVGNTGAAHLGLALVDALDRAAPGDVVLVLSLADGADAFVLRATDELLEYRRERESVRTMLTRHKVVPYPTYLLWRGRLERERPRRPDPLRPSAPFAARNSAFKFGFQGGRCTACGLVQFPQPQICLRCGANGEFEPVAAASAGGARIVTLTVDRLAFTPSPPLVSAVLDLDAGGRIQCELTDVIGAAPKVGDRVTLTFRRLFTTEGIHNYFWKARPVPTPVESD